MRQKADKLEKGKWYADLYKDRANTTFLKMEKEEKFRFHFSDQKGEPTYEIDDSGFITISSMIFTGFIPTQEDRQKYNLVDDE